MSTFSERFIEALKRNNISYGELAKITGIPKTTLYKYANQEVDRIPVDRIPIIARALHVSPEYLSGWEEKEITEPETGSDLSLNDREQAFINWLRSLPEEKRQAVLNFADRF